MSNNVESILNVVAKKKTVKVGAIIQARMTSKRFPGKSMALLKGVPVIEHVIENCKQIKGIDLVILAVPDTPESDPLLEIAEKCNVQNFCGKEDDVLSRYYHAAKFFDLDVIIRITGDCPFVNPTVCAEVLQLFLFRKLDYCCNMYPKRTYPKGLDCEVFSMDCLEAAYMISDVNNTIDREHVTPWMQRTDGIRKANVIQKIDASGVDLCVDHPEDIARLETFTFKVANNDQ